MNVKLLYLAIFICSTSFAKEKKMQSTEPVKEIKKSLETHHKNLTIAAKNKTKSGPVKIGNVGKTAVKPPTVRKNTVSAKMIPPDLIQQWAKEISEKLYENEEHVVQRDELLKSFSDIKIEIRNGSAIVEKMATALEELLERRTQAAEAIMRKAEKLAKDQGKAEAPWDYVFDYSVNLDKLKEVVNPESELEYPVNCTNLDKVKLENSTHFDAKVSLKTSSVHYPTEVFVCDPRVLRDIYWSKSLLSTFKENYAQDATTEFQYFCGANGFLRHYPAALWDDMFKLKLDVADVYDCRLRPWYVSASGAPRDVLVLLDASGSMNSSNQYVAEQFTSTLLNALTDDDQTNVLRFNVIIESPISCFNEKLVPANHVNSAAMMSALKQYTVVNVTDMEKVLEYAVGLLQKQRDSPDRPNSCQQAIVLLTDSLYDNYTDLLRHLDPTGRIRLFVFWLHDPFGLRDNTHEYGEWVSCVRDGYFAELISNYDVTEQVMRILRIMERPLVAQRERRLRVYSDVYAHVQDPRMAEHYWKQKENTEQDYRYKELRKNKERLLNQTNMNKCYMHQVGLDKFGHYYEGVEVNYKLQISVAVPVFDYATSENITIKLAEDMDEPRSSTRTYPVNRLLGVAGVDIPIDHLKLILPYHQLGASGSLFIVDHRGNIVLHDNIKPVFDGDVLKPGYRTVDFLDIEQPALEHLPRHYPREWLEFRKALIIDKPYGNKTIYSKNIFEDGMRVILEMREYHWRRVMDHYTAVIAIPKYNRHHAVPDAKFTQKIADDALRALSGPDFSIHPDWLYCRHVDPYFTTREAEILHFIRRRRDEPNFAMKKLKHFFSPLPPKILDKTYQCDEEIMARLCKEAVATEQWAREREDLDMDDGCPSCQLGAITAFFATENGLTRWKQYHATSAYASPPEGSVWSRGPSEPWYKRATAAPDTLVVHAPVTPARKMRNTNVKPPPLGERYKWLTAARTLGHPTKGLIGVAGYHFYAEHLENLLNAITNFPCTEDDEEKCEPRCDGDPWSCLLVDEGGWVVAGGTKDKEDISEEEPVREHLATLHPAVMAALLNATVFKLHWMHDYQAVCFPPEKDDSNAASPMLPTLLRSLWRSVATIFHISGEVITLLTLISSGKLVAGDTEMEKGKRRKRVRRDYERVKFEQLFDPKVLVNRTKFAACDRSRPFYQLQRSTWAMEALKHPPQPCSWPLSAAVVPKTNLLLIAVYTRCQHEGRPVPDPFANEPVEMTHEEGIQTIMQSSESQLACWRTRVPLPARPPRTACYPHNYTQEEGYRQCGPWLPDKENNAVASV